MPNRASYTPRHICEQILAVRGAIEGERKQVSALFCDIVASSALAAELGPEEKPKACSAAQYARRATLGTCEGTRHEGVGNDD